MKKPEIEDKRTSKTIVHVNQHRIKSNSKHGTKEPVLTVKRVSGNHYSNEVVIAGPCRVVYRPEYPLSCGARVWIETDHEVIAIGEEVKATAQDEQRKEPH